MLTIVSALLVVSAPAASGAEFSFSKTDYPLATAAGDVDLGDLDGANGPDLVYTTATGSDGVVVRLLNQGGGAFGAPQSTVTCANGYELIVHNFTPLADANLDALVTCGAVRGDGVGNFTSPATATNAPIQEGMVLAELTGSGVPELVYGGPATGATNALCFSTWSAANFSEFTCGNPPAVTSEQPRQFRRFSRASPTAVPFDNAPAGHTPRDEIVAESAESPDKINIYGRNPATNYNSWIDTTRTTSAAQISGIAHGDADGDGSTDLVVSHGIDTDPRFDTFLWDSTVASDLGLATTPLQTATIARPVDIAVDDFNRDGDADVALANGIGQLAVHSGNGDGTFEAPEIFALAGSASNETSVEFVVSDVSGDGASDIVVIEGRAGGDGNLAVLINGSEPPAPPQPPTPPPGNSGDTVPPQTTIDRAPKAKTNKPKAKFRFSADEAGSSFECKLDKKPYEACASPQKYTVGVGKHKFLVRATDAVGNTDPSPAVAKFKVTG